MQKRLYNIDDTDGGLSVPLPEEIRTILMVRAKGARSTPRVTSTEPLLMDIEIHCPSGPSRLKPSLHGRRDTYTAGSSGEYARAGAY
jgi:hypothetical protein